MYNAHHSHHVWNVTVECKVIVIMATTGGVLLCDKTQPTSAKQYICARNIYAHIVICVWRIGVSWWNVRFWFLLTRRELVLREGIIIYD